VVYIQTRTKHVDDSNSQIAVIYQLQCFNFRNVNFVANSDTPYIIIIIIEFYSFCN